MGKKKPPEAPKSLKAPSRESTQKYKASWSLGSEAGSGDKAYDSQVVHWKVNTSVKSGGKYGKYSYKALANNKVAKETTANTVNVNRANYYPNKTVLLAAIAVQVEAKNSEGSAKTGWKTLKFAKPKKPSIKLTYEESTGLLTVEISAPGDNKYDRYDCQYQVHRQDKNTDSSRYKDGKKRIALDRSAKELSGTSKSDSFKLYSMVETAYLKDGASITFTVTAKSRGYCGNSDPATQSLVVSSPTRAEITKVDVSNKDKLGLSKNLLRVGQADGSVRVFYKSAEGKQNAAYDAKEPNKYTLQRAVTPYKINTPIKAEVYQDWTDNIDTNEGTTSESCNKYKKVTMNRYTSPKFQKKEKVQYYIAKDNKTNRTTAKFPEWNLAAYKNATYTVNKKKKKRYSNIRKSSKGKFNAYKAYDNKNKKWVTNIPYYLVAGYKKVKYSTKKKKNLDRYSKWTKLSQARYANYYQCTDNKTGKTVKNIPEWKIATYTKGYISVEQVKKTPVNPSDGVMGEPLIDVFQAMGFGASGGVYDKRVWYRIKCEKYGMVEYSRAFEAVEFRAPTPTAKNDYAGFTRLIQNPNNPGTSILGTVAWNNGSKNDEGIDNPNWRDAQWTTIIEYSKYKEAHKSNEKASTLEIDWSNSAKTHKQRQKDYTAMVKKGDFTYKKNGRVDKNAIPWKSSADFAIYGLEPGVPIYLWVKRHMVLGEFDKYGPRTTAPTVGSGYWPFTPIDNPTAVVAYVPEYYLRGDDLTISWMHNAVCEQKSWAIYAFPADDLSKYKAGTTNVTSIPKHLLAAGTGKRSSYTVKASEIEKILGKSTATFTANGTKYAFSVTKRLGIVVGVSTGGAEILSFQDSKKKYVEVDTAQIVLKPTCKLWAPSTYVSLRTRKVYVFTNTPEVTGVVNVYAVDDITRYLPDGAKRQSIEECVWNRHILKTEFKPCASALTNSEKRLDGISMLIKGASKCAYVAVITIPYSFKELIHSCRYRVEAYTISGVSQAFKSSVAKTVVTCKYTHAPQAPSKACNIVRGEIIPYNSVVDEVIAPSNASSMSAKIFETYPMPVSPSVFIKCIKPENYVSTDRCEVYRVTPDSVEMIASDVVFGQFVVDRYAPFSKIANLRYVIATITAEGRREWREVAYDYPRHGMRFDWGDLGHERSVELPFDIELNPSYEKHVRISSHIDGSIQAYFNPGTSKTESVSTKLVRLGNPHQFEMVKELAQFEGTCFFRAHDGSAYECVARVSGIANSFDSQVSPVTIELTRVSLSDRFKPIPGTDDFRNKI